MKIISLLRRNIGTIVAFIGFLLLCIVTFGNLAELFGPKYWENVRENITAISFMSIGLTLIQVSIRQGIAEQALQRGLNSEFTSIKYKEHREIIKQNTDRMIYLPYFLQVYNKRHTKLRKQEFLVNNNYSSEKILLQSGDHKAIRKYKNIIINVTTQNIKWSSNDVIYDKNGKIITLNEHRMRRTFSAVVSSLMCMIGTTFLTQGLFRAETTEPLWQKFVKLFTYCFVIAIGSIFTVTKEYEKGAFGVPNELEEINQIWYEFEAWEIPDWVVKEVESINNEVKIEEVTDEQESQRTIDSGTDIQEEQEEV